MSFTSVKITCVILVIFITFGKSDQGEVEAYFEDAKDISMGRTYYWKNWCFCQDTMNYLYIWCEAAALKLRADSIGWFKFVIDGYSFTMYSSGDYEKNVNLEFVLKDVRRLINSTTHTQPILSAAGSTKLVVGNWFLISRKEGEMTIQHASLPHVITLREDFSGFTFVSTFNTSQTFSSSMGTEFSPPWISGRNINRLHAKTESLRLKTKHHSNFTSCSAFNTNTSDSTLTEIQCHTDSRLHNISYVWNIDRFNFHRPVEGDNKNNVIRSPTFSSVTHDELEWYLEILPGNITSNTIELYLKPNSSFESQKPKPLAQFSVDFLDSKGNLIHTLASRLHLFSNLGRGWDIPIENIVSPDNKLNIVCKISVCEFTTKAVNRNRTDTTSNPNYNPNPDIVPIIKNIEFSDIVLVLSKNGKEYPAHKVILAARSPVFATILQRRMKKGKRIKRIIVKDIDEYVFDELLRYIYTGKCENIENLTSGLLVAAKKYDIEGLKTICVEKMIKRLTVENAVDTLVLAHRHGIGELKSKAVRFIAENYAQISNSSDWKHLIEAKNGKLVNKVCLVLSNSNISDKEIAED